MDYEYHLQKYAGPTSRHTCPNCGGKRCFTLYVDSQGQPLADNVGRCDHESGCNYHYTPGQYFHDHPELRQPYHPECSEGSWRPKPVHQRPPVHSRPPADKLDVIPPHIVTRSFRPDYESHLTRFLATIIDPVTLEGIIHDYRLGVTRARDVIFFQIDTQGRVRTGKIMKYDPETGHRIKDEATKGRITWVHSLMKTSGELPQTWTLTQCLFGEHLLARYPDKPVGLVESEKTAVICAALIPQFVWLATGGKSQLNERLNVLRGRKVTAFPDIDGYEAWTQKLAILTTPAYHPERSEESPSCHPEAEPKDLDIQVADLLQRYGTPEDHAAHIDIADWLIRWRRSANPRADATFAAVAQYFAPEVHNEIQALIRELDLELVQIFP